MRSGAQVQMPLAHETFEQAMMVRKDESHWGLTLRVSGTLTIYWFEKMSLFTRELVRDGKPEWSSDRRRAVHQTLRVSRP